MTSGVISHIDARYPACLSERLGEDAPMQLSVLGNPDLLAQTKTALFCSSRCPGNAILSAYDNAVRWRDEGRCIISGFHSSVEKECLRILLRGKQPIIICPARSLEGMRIPTDWKAPLANRRLLVLSGFPSHVQRATKASAITRNQLVAALAEEAWFAHVDPGGSLEALKEKADRWSNHQHQITA